MALPRRQPSVDEVPPAATPPVCSVPYSALANMLRAAGVLVPERRYVQGFEFDGFTLRISMSRIDASGLPVPNGLGGHLTTTYEVRVS